MYNNNCKTTGEKIKKYRKIRKMSQKELGLKCDFSKNTADVRIAQYEQNDKTPRDTALNKIADALEVNKYALFDFNLTSNDALCHALFDMSDFHGLEPVKINGEYYLSFNDAIHTGINGEKYIKIKEFDYNNFLKEWLQKREEYHNGTLSETEYQLWCAKYKSKSNINKQKELEKQISILQKELSRLKEGENS